jgi:redox-sensitive bicupin YhaK (pirin superfamily)
MDDPRYGTEAPERLPLLELGAGSSARLLAGKSGDATGPFRTVQPLQMVDFDLAANAVVTHSVPHELDNVLLFCYRGAATVGGSKLPSLAVARLDATDSAARDIALAAGDQGARVMLFAGKRLQEPIAWHGPIVMSSQADVAKTFSELRSGNFPPVRVPWDYKRLSSFPADHKARRAAATAEQAVPAARVDARTA